jgi:hypothetical protein
MELNYTTLSELPNARQMGNISIGSHTVPVWTVDLTDASVYGCATDAPEPAIWLNSKQTKQQMNRTLVHEMFEVVNNVYDLGLSETQIRILEQTICQSFYVRRKP